MKKWRRRSNWGHRPPSGSTNAVVAEFAQPWATYAYVDRIRGRIDVRMIAVMGRQTNPVPDQMGTQGELAQM